MSRSNLAPQLDTSDELVVHIEPVQVAAHTPASLDELFAGCDLEAAAEPGLESGPLMVDMATGDVAHADPSPRPLTLDVPKPSAAAAPARRVALGALLTALAGLSASVAWQLLIR